MKYFYLVDTLFYHCFIIVLSLFYHCFIILKRHAAPFQGGGPGTISMICVSTAHIVMGSDFSQAISKHKRTSVDKMAALKKPNCQRSELKLTPKLTDKEKPGVTMYK